ncbi:replication-associated recombination protein A [Halioxenophilus sp. WMMB6]|uniref:replication-associated recombination protein A n=1 Tax=Halioxenophilus sp. WMMB6 TaxID=3073815 RepID=UPI00295EF206|nr:replication-associated recombination protein A [Halioxenophilus sp. WMMB6]
MTQSLFDQQENEHQPLAARMRPRSLAEYVGQQHLLAEGKPLRKALACDKLHSMILWGPPGVGKTSLAHTIAESSGAYFEPLSAVLAGVKEVRAAVEMAKQRRAGRGQSTVVFVDEVHRFNKSQQDAFLPHVEDGSIVLIGATTENPSFELNNALLSRCRVYLLKSLTEDDLSGLLQQALTDHQRGLGTQQLTITADARQRLIVAAQGDARMLLNLLEMCSDLLGESEREINLALLNEVLSSDVRRFDKGGDLFYDQISALHKSLRGSDPDAALYWFARMLDGGCDPLYIARRLVRMASEDIGNADPRALEIALNAWLAQERLGSPEGELVIAQAVTYLACAAKSNAVYNAFNAVRADIKSQPSYEVPYHLRNAPTKLMEQQGFGDGYRYAHDEPEAFAAGENYFPEPLRESRYYNPPARGLEIKIGEKLQYLRALNQNSPRQRYGQQANEPNEQD